ASDFLLDLDRIAEEIFLAELGRCQRLPHLLRRGGDVDGVDRQRLELVEFHGGTRSSIELHLASKPSRLDMACCFQAALATSSTGSGFPVSRKLFRLAITIGQPPEMSRRVLPPSSRLSWVTVSLITLPRGSRSKVTREVRSRRASSEQGSQV